MLMLMTETRSTRRRLSWLLAAAVLLSVATMAPRPVALEMPLEAQGRGGGRGQGGPPPEPPTGRGLAPVDLTGYWVSIVTEDWRFRMVTPPKGDYASLPINQAARDVADAWDPARDEAEGNQCKSYGAAAIMRVPGRVHITWQDDDTLRIETDAGRQTRVLHFGDVAPSGPPTLQGHSVAAWELPARGRGRGRGRGPGPGPTWASLRVRTTNLSPGYLRKNGVPYSDQTTVTEYVDRHSESDGAEWFTVTTIVEDPVYLNQDFVTSSSFRREPDDAKWNPTPCSAR